jgi:hypothetical protein
VEIFASVSIRMLALAGLAFTAGCGPKSAASADSVASATQRLQGTWKVAAFTPESTLEPPLQGLLNAQLGTLAITFQGDSFSAAGPGINFTGNFKIWSATFYDLSGSVYDQTGVAYRVSGQFEGPDFLFRSYDSPWKGQGKLVR